MGALPLLPRPDVLIRGAGVIGLSLALELRQRGAEVTVTDRGPAGAQASFAAAGMLAAEDPHNPPALLPFSRRSLALYPDFLASISALSGQAVPFQTDTTIQTLSGGQTMRLAEHSLDPRQLFPALLAAARQAGVRVREHAPSTTRPETADAIVHATGAWSEHVSPRKGQMLRVALPPGHALTEVHRSEHVYIVPRTLGPQAGTALIGATVEDAGFDVTTTPEALANLRRLAATLVPSLIDEQQYPMIEAWAGLRPSTPDSLPILDEIEPASCSHPVREFVASGHFRNGILLAPITAVIMADLIEGRSPGLDLTPFSASRFAAHPAETAHR